jgi:SAM-dependent methyltransferase
MIDINNYCKTFPNYPKCLIDDKGVIAGYWWVGNYYKRKYDFHGEYPPSYLKRIRALFPKAESVLHLFSGVVEKEKDEVTFDINLDLRPDFVGCAESLSEYFAPDSFDLIIADPPYSKADAEKYGYPLPNKRIVLREARAVCKPGGFLVWLDLIVPIFRKADWKLRGTIGLHCGTNRKVRVISLFEAQ